MHFINFLMTLYPLYYVFRCISCVTFSQMKDQITNYKITIIWSKTLMVLSLLNYVCQIFFGNFKSISSRLLFLKCCLHVAVEEGVGGREEGGQVRHLDRLQKEDKNCHSLPSEAFKIKIHLKSVNFDLHASHLRGVIILLLLVLKGISCGLHPLLTKLNDQSFFNALPRCPKNTISFHRKLDGF